MGEQLSEANRALIEAAGLQARSQQGIGYFVPAHTLDQLLDAARSSGPHPESGDEGNHDCLAKRRPGEPMFITLGRDPDGHNMVRQWAERRLAAGGDHEHCQMALDTAARMQVYAANPANRPASAPSAEAYPPLPAAEVNVSALRHADDCQSHIVDTRGRPDDCTCGAVERARSEGPHPEQIAENANCSSPSQLLAESASYPAPDESGEWVMVPREPMPEMISAWYRVKNGHHFHDEPAPTDTSDYAAYRAMIAASPPPLEEAGAPSLLSQREGE